MSNVQWIKITTNIFDDEKIKLIESLPDSDMLLVIWFKLLTLAGKCNAGGMIYIARDVPYNPEMLSTIMNRPINTIRLALTEFQNLRMIEIFNDFISIINWEKHQNLQKLELIKEQTRERVQKHRIKNKLLCNADVTNCNATDKIREDKNRIDKNNKREKQLSIPPTIQEVEEYITSNLLNLDAQWFIDYYSARGWMVGKYKMRDWQAAVRTCERNKIKWDSEKKNKEPERKSLEQRIKENEELFK